MLKLWENPMLSKEDRLEIANGEIERIGAQRDAAATLARRYLWLRKNFTRLIVSTDPAYSPEIDRGITIVRSVQINANFRDCDEASVDAAIDEAMHNVRANRPAAPADGPG